MLKKILFLVLILHLILINTNALQAERNQDSIINFQEGDRSSAILEIKEKLNQVGFGGIIVSDYYGSFMKQRVEEFQSYYGLAVTGIADEETVAKLTKVLSAPKEGDRSPAIREIKEKLNQVGFGGIIVSDYYGSFMKQRVEEFQSYYGLAVNGIADEKTVAKLTKVSSAPREGDRSPAIREIKEKLNQVGFGGIIVSDYYGSFMKQRVEEFQSYYGLAVNGIADEKTVAKLTDILDSPYQKGKRNSEIIKIKEDLDRAGFGGSVVSNYIGEFTKQKIKEFQKYYQLPISGIMEESSLKTLKDAVNNIIPRSVPSVVNGAQVYSYRDMQKDIDRLVFLYPGLIEKKVIGKSVDNRNIYAIKLGNGKEEVFFNGSFHAREHMTTNVLMKMIDDYAQSYAKQTNYHGFRTKSILDDVSIWFVPMVNPDGVMLVQNGANTARNPQNVISLNRGSTNFNSWKANIRGVDLNRQFPYKWRTITNNSLIPSYAYYKGTAPLTEPEAKAIYDFTNQHNFKAAISYHSSGEVIYTRFGYENHTRPATLGVQQITGYRPINLQNSSSGGGYTDWFISQKRGIGMTMEISPYVPSRPVPLSNWNRIWNQNRTVGLYIANYVRRN